MKLIPGCRLVQSREKIVLKKNLVEQVICFQESGTADQKLCIRMISCERFSYLVNFRTRDSSDNKQHQQWMVIRSRFTHVHE